jgi:hypothetical protein
VLSENADESIFMPNTGDLPENLRATDFHKQFRDIYSPEFDRIKRLIDERVDRLTLYGDP